jgi:hypothetical protein
MTGRPIDMGDGSEAGSTKTACKFSWRRSPPRQSRVSSLPPIQLHRSRANRRADDQLYPDSKVVTSESGSGADRDQKPVERRASSDARLADAGDFD